jgi:hypothetical protein
VEQTKLVVAAVDVATAIAVDVVEAEASTTLVQAKHQRADSVALLAATCSTLDTMQPPTK